MPFLLHSSDAYSSPPSSYSLLTKSKFTTAERTDPFFRLKYKYNEFMVDGGHAVKALKPKVDVFAAHVNSHTGILLPHFDVQYIVCASIALKSTGGILFILDSSFGAYNLLLHQIVATPILYDFYNYDRESKEFNQLFIKFTQNMALLGALLFFIGMKNSSPRRQLKRVVIKSKSM